MNISWSGPLGIYFINTSHSNGLCWPFSRCSISLVLFINYYTNKIKFIIHHSFSFNIFKKCFNSFDENLPVLKITKLN